jgi:WD40 repeat protein
VLRGFADRVWSVAFSPSSTLLAAGVQDGTIHLWDLSTPVSKEIGMLDRHVGAVRAVRFLPGGKVLVSCGEDGMVILWELASGKTLWDWQLPGAVHDVACAPDGAHLATGNSNGTVYILRISELPPLRVGNYLDAR